MTRRAIYRAATVAMVLGVLLAPAQGALASSEYITGTIYRNQDVFFTKERTVTATNSNFYFQKTDGPGMYLGWYKCGERSNNGGYIYFNDTDPTARQYIGGPFRYGAPVCLMARSNGSLSQDTFSGNLNWNVYS
jgi:hypothetical protein